MRERLGIGPRPTGMWMRALGTLVALPVVLAGCGDSGSGDTDGLSDESSIVCTGSPDGPAVTIDLDGDGAGDAVRVGAAPVDGTCSDAVVADVDGKQVVARFEYGLAVEADNLAGVQIPGRDGALLLITAQHPRGGFQAVLYGFADGELEELTVDGGGIFPFVATDAPSTPLSADCTDDGFEITRARAHEPIGVAPAWDVDRTTYTVDGNAVTRGATTEVADNVLEKDFRATYRSLTSYSLFAGCRTDR